MKILIINCSPVKNGATAEIAKILADEMPAGDRAETVCLGDLNIHFCRGCKTCYTSAKCDIDDGVGALLCEMDAADRIVFIVPSYWGDFPGQFKTFVDRCTPYCNTKEPHASLRPGKKGYAAVLRMGMDPGECLRIIDRIWHYCGHMEIEPAGSAYFCGIRGPEDIRAHQGEIAGLAGAWFCS
jgi:multimeric flavodoxin WrbA